MTNTDVDRLRESMLDLFTTWTKLPVGWYEMADAGPVETVTTTSREAFEPYCKYIQQFEKGREKCDRDQCGRANASFAGGEPRLAPCYAGMFNQSVPVEVSDARRAVVLFGQMRIATPEQQQISVRLHEQAVVQLGLTQEQASKWRLTLESSKLKDLAEVESYQRIIAAFAQWYYHIVQVSERMDTTIDRVTHEISTRLQTIVTRAENLSRWASVKSPAEVQELSRTILMSTMALETVIQTLGDYLAEYRFEPANIDTMLAQARRVYYSEATAREIDIHLKAEPGAVDVSRAYLQHALNNLVHNAVKYSFSGTSRQRRYVSIKGRIDGDQYVIAVTNFGVGITGDEISTGMLFQNGYKGKLSQGEYRSGSGKGLYFVKKVLDEHRGAVTVTSDASNEILESGMPYHNRFVVSLPIKRKV